MIYDYRVILWEEPVCGQYDLVINQDTGSNILGINMKLMDYLILFLVIFGPLFPPWSMLTIISWLI